jgi:hypothetical protein
MLSGNINPDQNAIISNTSKITWSSQGIQVTDPSGSQNVATMTKNGFTVKNGAFSLVNSQNGALLSSLEKKQNLIKDHSFELQQAGAEATNGYFEISQKSDDGTEDNWNRWWSIGAPKIYSVLNTDAPVASPFGYKHVAVKSTDYIRQSIDVTKGRTFTVSAHFFDSTLETVPGSGKLQVDFVKYRFNQNNDKRAYGRLYLLKPVSRSGNSNGAGSRHLYRVLFTRNLNRRVGELGCS